MKIVFLFLSSSLNMLISRFIHAAANDIITFFKHLNDIPFSVCISIYIFFIHSPVNGQLGCFHVLAIVSFAAMNIGVHESFQGIVFYRYMLGIGIVGSYGYSVFHFLRNFHIVFRGDCTSFHSPNSVRGFPSSPHPLQHLLFINCLMMAILIGVKWYLLAVSICLSLLMSNAEHLFICLLAICVSSFKPQISIVRVMSMDFG